MSDWLLDAPLAVAVVWIAWRALAPGDLFRSVVLFIAFGLLVAVIWVRLAAPDVALAEAAIGAGVTGGLLLRAAGAMEVEPRPRRRSSLARVGWTSSILLLLSVVGGALALTIRALDDGTDGLRAEVLGSFGAGGSSNPVTAVLLDFRAYDTLLELAVLAVAAMVVLFLARPAGPGLPQGSLRDPVLAGATRLLVPVVAVAAAHLLIMGTTRPGGAFQGGALLAGAIIIAFAAGLRPAVPGRVLRWRAPILLGLGTLLVLAIAPLAAGRAMLDLSGGSATFRILVAEVAIAVSTAWTLGLLFIAAAPPEP